MLGINLVPKRGDPVCKHMGAKFSDKYMLFGGKTDKSILINMNLQTADFISRKESNKIELF